MEHQHQKHTFVTLAQSCCHSVLLGARSRPQYYQVPRLWLVGYDESRHPLAPQQVTVMSFVAGGRTAAPCHARRHAQAQIGLRQGLPGSITCANVICLTHHISNRCTTKESDMRTHPHRPLSQVLEDVSEEHARKTITVDPHPHLPISAASIHPCRHADVMKRLVDNLLAAGKQFAVNQ